MLNSNSDVFSISTEDVGLKRFFTNVFLWMSIGIAVTAIVALYVSGSKDFMSLFFKARFMFWGLIIAQFGLVYFIASRLMDMTYKSGILFYMLYSVLNGVTISVVLFRYTSQSIASTFFITAGMFALMAIYGYSTKKSLMGWGKVLMMGLIGIIIAAVVNIFLRSGMMQWIISLAGVIIFTGLTAYDTQKLKSYYAAEDSVGGKRLSQLSLFGALMLYIDFINLFLSLLSLSGGRKD